MRLCERGVPGLRARAVPVYRIPASKSSSDSIFLGRRSRRRPPAGVDGGDDDDARVVGSERPRRYMHLRYCVLGAWPTFAVVAALALWLSLLISLLATTADNFFVPQLETLSMYLDLSPDVAGITLLALGNGAPDVFAARAALTGGATDFPLMLSDLLGASVFISTVVLGCVMKASSAKHDQWGVDAPTLKRDLGVYVVAVAAIFAAAADGVISLGEALSFLGLYAGYIGLVLGESRFRKARKTASAMLDEPLLAVEEEHLAAEEVNVSTKGGTMAGLDWALVARGGGAAAKVQFVFEYPFSVLRWLSIPGADLHWDRRRRAWTAAAPPFLALIVCLDVRRAARERPGGRLDAEASRGLGGGAADRFLIPKLSRKAPRTVLDPETERRRDRVGSPRRRRGATATASTTSRGARPSSAPFRWTRRASALRSAPSRRCSSGRRRTTRRRRGTTASLSRRRSPPRSAGSTSSRRSSWPSSRRSGARAGRALLANMPSRDPASARRPGFDGSFSRVVARRGVASNLFGGAQVLGISTSLLGLTVIAIGNSVGDLVADVATARDISPRMAVASCFGSPLLNDILGVGVAATTYCVKHGGLRSPLNAQDRVAYVFLAASLASSAVAFPLLGFFAPKKTPKREAYPLYLFGLYGLFMVASCVVEASRGVQKTICAAGHGASCTRTSG